MQYHGAERFDVLPLLEERHWPGRRLRPGDVILQDPTGNHGAVEPQLAAEFVHDPQQDIRVLVE